MKVQSVYKYFNTIVPKPNLTLTFFRFYSKHVDVEASINDVGNVVRANDSDDENDICAFYRLPDMDENDEEKFFTLLR